MGNLHKPEHLVDPDRTCVSVATSPPLKTREPEPDGSSAAPAMVHDVLRSPGRPLEPETRASLEPSLGMDLSAVRVHTDATAAASAHAVDALAYTIGRDIAFAAGTYAPDIAARRRVLVPALTHPRARAVRARAAGPVLCGRPRQPPRPRRHDRHREPDRRRTRGARTRALHRSHQGESFYNPVGLRGRWYSGSETARTTRRLEWHGHPRVAHDGEQPRAPRIGVSSGSALSAERGLAG